MRFNENDADSDYGHSDELHTASDSDEEGVGKPSKQFPIFNAEENTSNPTFEIGMLFQNKEVFKEACRNKGIRHRYQVYFPKNDNLRVRCKCFK